jgi:hypothetical protein
MSAVTLGARLRIWRGTYESAVALASYWAGAGDSQLSFGFSLVAGIAICMPTGLYSATTSHARQPQGTGELSTHTESPGHTHTKSILSASLTL